MKVIKRDGRIQEFEMRKIILTLEKASDEAGTPFTRSDIENITRGIEKKVLSKYEDKINVDQILNIVVDQLREDGFGRTAQYYENYKTELYNK